MESQNHGPLEVRSPRGPQSNIMAPSSYRTGLPGKDPQGWVELCDLSSPSSISPSERPDNASYPILQKRTLRLRVDQRLAHSCTELNF